MVQVDQVTEIDRVFFDAQRCYGLSKNLSDISVFAHE